MVCNNEDGDSNASCAKSSLQTVAESLGNSYQAGILLDFLIMISRFADAEIEDKVIDNPNYLK